MSDSPSAPFGFKPVPSASRRHDGWTPERQLLFIVALAKCRSVGTAAASVGMSRKSAYALLDRAGAESGFARAWRAARAARAAERFAAASTRVRRALEGVEIPYIYRGRQRGSRQVHDNRLLIAALRAIDRAERAEARAKARRPGCERERFRPNVPELLSPSEPSARPRRPLRRPLRRRCAAPKAAPQ
jgi:hypothetical protein